jgi:hypothetical protein
MKIIENTPDRLVLRGYPIMQIVFGLIFGLSGLLPTFFFARSVDLHCDKLEDSLVNCQVDEKLMGYLSLGVRQIPHVTEATVDSSTDSDGDTTYKVIFITTEKTVSLTGYSSSGYNSKADLAARVNRFIQNSGQRSLDLRLDMEWWILIFLAVFGGVGAVAILLSKITRIEMVRSEGVMRIIQTGLFGSRQEEHILREVEAVALERSRSNNSTTYRIAFRMADGGERLLSSWYSSGRKGKQQAVDAMNAFLAKDRPASLEE